MSKTTVNHAINSRFSARIFTDQAVPTSTIQEILATAIQAPSNGNLQPWNVVVAQGEKLDAALAQFNQGLYQDGKLEQPQYAIYPDNISKQHKARRKACGELMYDALGISKEDKPARIQQAMKNFSFFGAPTGLILSMHEDMGMGQAIDTGIFAQNIMLLATERGLASCPQASWAQWPNRVRECFGIAKDHLILMGIAIGYADMGQPVNNSRQPRIATDDCVTFL